ncbi:MAG: YlmH/Sll1252 family protein [Lachnospiraceae bacterium]|nr:YlmH/Sll1252 family protein [Lachnospiraceae bacterium]
MDLTKEEQITYRHLRDLKILAEKRGIPVFSRFMGLNDINILYRLLEDNGITEDIAGKYVMAYGGYQGAERLMACFLPDTPYGTAGREDFPIECVKISPGNSKFCDALTHRDYLGTVLGLGIERNQIGDIIVKREENGAVTGYIFCCKDKAPFIKDITRVRHTAVYTETACGTDLELIQEYKDIPGSVSSLRADAVAAVAAKTSRSKSLLLIKEGSVSVNGRICTEGSKNICDGDIISIRGYGKYRIEAPLSVTKKGRYHITVKKYI